MRLCDIGDAYARTGSVTERVWNLVAYVGRYGNQPVSDAMRLTSRDLSRLAKSVANIIRDENEANKGSSDMG